MSVVKNPATQQSTGVVPRTARAGRRVRRPTGSPPPLPRELGTSGKLWVGLAIAFALLLPWVVLRGRPDAGLHFDTSVLQAIASLRVGWLTELMRGINLAGAGYTLTILGWITVVLLVVFKRWRHLFVFIGTLAIVEVLGSFAYLAASQPRPYGVTIIGGWGGFALPSFPVGTLATCLIGMTYSLVVPGRPRWLAKWAIGGTLAVFAFARLYLAVDPPSAVVGAIVLGVAIPLAAFRLFTPNDVFPVTYRRGRTAHLDVAGPRGDAIRRAIAEQLGLTVLEIKPVGLEGSGGSTPLRLRIAGNPDTFIFAKLYAKNHVRADRWYKLGRIILYGSLEDEVPFQTVRRFVEYEDYTLRLLQAHDLPVPAAFGIVEITPEREYLIAMEFFEGAVEIGEADLDDDTIERALLVVRKLWDAGLAHRDIKPANLMVRDGQVLLIDVFFAQVRPSPWRQAVDLANMMLVLAVRSDPERVYALAQKHFSHDEIAEAFAATRGVASPTQLRTAMKDDGRDLLGEFRRLAPERKQIGIQRWSIRRLALALGTLVVLISGVVFVAEALSRVDNPPVLASPGCRPDDATILLAQSVPSATSIPCIVGLPSGWDFGGADVRDGHTTFWLNSDRAGERAVAVSMTESCDTSVARPATSDEPGMQRFDDATPASDGIQAERIYRFVGGCVTYGFSFDPTTHRAILLDAQAALSFFPRLALVGYVKQEDGLALCGAGTRCPG